MTTRAQTTAGTNAGSFAPGHRDEVDLLLTDTDLEALSDTDLAWVEEAVAVDEATDYLRGLLHEGPPAHVVPPRGVPRHPVNECAGADLPRVAYLGKDTYDPDLVESISNIVGFCKPAGGTWLSPVNDDGTTVWTEHCKTIQYESATRGRRVHPVGLHPEARVLKIDSMDDLQGVIDTHGGIVRDDMVRPDFEELSCHYDAVWLTRRGMNQTYVPVGSRPIHRENLNAWEIESVLVLRPDAVHST